MTEAPAINPLAITTPITTSTFAAISNIKATPAQNAFTVTFDTDVAIQIQMDYWSHNDPSIPPGIAGIVSEGAATTRHTFTTPALPAGNHAGYTFGFSLRKDANDVSGVNLRSQQGFVRLINARSSRNLSTPVRFNQYGDGSRPSGGGGIGNWSSYTWAQYNPKVTTYPTP